MNGYRKETIMADRRQIERLKDAHRRWSASMVWCLVLLQSVVVALLPDNFMQWAFLTWTLCAAVFMSRLVDVPVSDIRRLHDLVHDHVGYTLVATGALAFCGLLRLA